MRNSIFAALAVAVISTGALAADLPNKTTAPALPVPEDTSVEIQGLVSTAFTSNFVAGEYGEVSDFDYAVNYSYLGLGNGIAVGGGFVANGTDTTDITAKRVEANASWTAPAAFGVSTVIGGGLGYRLQEEDAYFVLNSGLNYEVNEFVTLNAVGYQFRDNFDNTWQSHEVGTGVTIKVVDNVSVTGKVARSYNEDLEASSDSLTLGASFAF